MPITPYWMRSWLAAFLGIYTPPTKIGGLEVYTTGRIPDSKAIRNEEERALIEKAFKPLPAIKPRVRINTETGDWYESDFNWLPGGVRPDDPHQLLSQVYRALARGIEMNDNSTIFTRLVLRGDDIKVRHAFPEHNDIFTSGV